MTSLNNSDFTERYDVIIVRKESPVETGNIRLIKNLFGYYGYVILSFSIRSARFCSQDFVSVGFLARKLKSL